MKKSLGYDPITKTRRTFVHHTEDDAFHVQTEQDVTDVIELTQAEFNALDERSPWRDLSRVASIPLTEVAELSRRGIWQDDKALLRYLDNPDVRKFRTRPGKLSS